MASIAHIVVGLSAATALAHNTRGYPPSGLRRLTLGLLLSGLALAPDLDVIGFRFGVAYSDPWGHRGASHALVFTAFLGLLLAVPVARMAQSRLAPAILATTLVAISHPLLDALTDGGLGVALFWPFSDSRHFAPLQPIPVAPIGRNFFTERGLHVALVELAFGAPMLIWMLWRARRQRP
jgi:inner membrane protein